MKRNSSKLFVITVAIVLTFPHCNAGLGTALLLGHTIRPKISDFSLDIRIRPLLAVAGTVGVQDIESLVGTASEDYVMAGFGKVTGTHDADDGVAIVELITHGGLP